MSNVNTLYNYNEIVTMKSSVPSVALNTMRYSSQYYDLISDITDDEFVNSLDRLLFLIQSPSSAIKAGSVSVFHLILMNQLVSYVQLRYHDTGS